MASVRLGQNVGGGGIHSGHLVHLLLQLQLVHTQFLKHNNINQSDVINLHCRSNLKQKGPCVSKHCQGEMAKANVAFAHVEEVRGASVKFLRCQGTASCRASYSVSNGPIKINF